MNDLLEQFLVETRELVQSATEDLLALEGRPGDAEAVNRVFRAFHTLKGSVGLFDYPPWFALLHAAEDGLSAARAGNLVVDASLVDLSLEALDATARWSDAIEATGRLPDAAGGEAAALAERYRSLLSPDRKSATEATGAFPDWAARLVASMAEAPGGPSTAVRYRPRGDCFFSGDDPLSLVRKVPGLLAVSVEPATPWPPDGEFDAYACNLDITLLAGAPRREVEAPFRLVSDQVTVVDVPATGTARPSSASAMDPVVAAILGEQLLAMAASGDPETAPGRLEACARSVANALRSIGRDAEAERCRDASERGAASLGPAIEAALAGGSPTDPGSDRETSGADERASGAHGAGTARTLRVDAVRVDALVGRVGELVVARNALGRLAARAEAGEDAATLARAIREADADIGRLATSLHRDAVSLRLMPLSEVFRRFARPVREAARSLDKEVRIDFEGEGTEADKGIVENLFEPLLHVVRNAVDHGLEDTGTRLRLGKPASGRIKIAAGQDGDGIIVSVSDDGRGIDPAFIRRRAAERGLRSREAVSAMDDAAVTDLIFAAGFSTAGSVGALSGRGVGMDAVRVAAERMGGRVSVESRVGEGTTVALHLPRTVALVRLLVVGIGEESYGIAMDAVAEVVRVPRSAIQAVAGGAATVLRGRTLPVLRLADLLDHRYGAGIGTEALLLVVRAADETVGLEIDRLDDRLDAVVRPPAGLVGSVPGVGGTTVLGDGGVLLVLDPAALLADPASDGRRAPEETR
ncbi:two-component system, chemotaxis family, sensor kinase CheA [Methylobacterium phyllostachyos]|uniref:Chemotaxis protein CheA n=1 Tax=Methylobacterium phyllostachyos TaxID=582672 RepID=A0A1G9U7P2_9HYPH|nr:chemotaxis protein CheA [Methylobacterium phyllostachyos]SDM55960.1 two-component system, chemotaxis family, sensor kinase CheA [Methylobacterium phyllostachyos]